MILIIQVMLYLIEILHQTTTIAAGSGLLLRCILSKFYIKPQPEEEPANDYLSCILSKFYIKPQQNWRYLYSPQCCILSKFYIKPQPKPTSTQFIRVVSYRNSTSNHNILPLITSLIGLYLIEILHQTTTIGKSWEKLEMLYLIEILHQTTTATLSWFFVCRLYLIEILHQTTTSGKSA